MGIKKGVTTNYGIDAPEAYHRIRSVRGENGGGIRYEVDTYFNETARDNNAEPLGSKTYNVPGDLRARLGVITELYNVLKKEPEFDGATDVLEPGIFPYFNSYITSAYLLSADIIDGLDTNTMIVTNGTIAGKFIVDGNIVSGTATNVSATGISLADVGYKNGYISSANIDGYVIQIL